MPHFLRGYSLPDNRFSRCGIKGGSFAESLENGGRVIEMRFAACALVVCSYMQKIMI